MIDKIFLLNLERRIDKKEKMIIKLNNNEYLKDKLELIKAVDGLELDKYLSKDKSIVINVNNWTNPYTGSVITNGEIGCALSHYEMWEKITKNRYENVLILEDDVDIDNNFENKLKNYYKQIRENNIKYDLFYLSRKSFEKDIEKLSENINVAAFSYWTCGYIITYEGACKLINSNYLLNVIPVDEFLPMCYLNDTKELNRLNYKIENFRAIVCQPHIIKPELNAFQSSDTEISKPYITDNSWLEYNNYKIQLVTVATDEVDGYLRFIESCKKYNFPCVTLGMNEKWEGSDLTIGPGGGHKVILLKKYINNLKYNDSENRIIIFTDSYDVILNSNFKEIIDKFLKFNCDIVFSGEVYCWPDHSLDKYYPACDTNFKYLNSGGIIGSIDNFKKLLQYDIKKDDDDQLYYTHIFLIDRPNLSIKIDYNCEIFQALSGVNYYIDILFAKSRIINKLTKSNPCLIHGNGGIESKLFLNQLSNYIPLVWRPTYLYQNTNLKLDFFKKLLYESYPIIHIIFLFIDKNHDNLDNILNLKYPKNRLKLTLIYFFDLKKKINNEIKDKFIEVNIIVLDINFNKELKKYFENVFKIDKSDYIFLFNNEHFIENNKILQLLIKKNIDIIAPLFIKRDSNYSNFWGEISEDGYYKRSFDYFEIINYQKTGCWNVPYINLTILISNKKFIDIYKLLYIKNIEENDIEDFDMYLNGIFRNKQIFMYVSNMEKYGYIR